RQKTRSPTGPLSSRRTEGCSACRAPLSGAKPIRETCTRPVNQWSGRFCSARPSWSRRRACQCSRPRRAGSGAGWLEVPGDAGGGDGRGQVELVDTGVVALAEQGGVVDVRAAAAGPPVDVVGIAPLRGHGAARVRASLVA